MTQCRRDNPGAAAGHQHRRGGRRFAPLLPARTLSGMCHTTVHRAGQLCSGCGCNSDAPGTLCCTPDRCATAFCGFAVTKGQFHHSTILAPDRRARSQRARTRGRCATARGATWPSRTPTWCWAASCPNSSPRSLAPPRISRSTTRPPGFLQSNKQTLIESSRYDLMSHKPQPPRY